MSNSTFTLILCLLYLLFTLEAGGFTFHGILTSSIHIQNQDSSLGDIFPQVRAYVVAFSEYSFRFCKFLNCVVLLLCMDEQSGGLGNACKFLILGFLYKFSVLWYTEAVGFFFFFFSPLLIGVL